MVASGLVIVAVVAVVAIVGVVVSFFEGTTRAYFYSYW